MHVEVHGALKQHPKFRRFCRILGIGPAHALGLLSSFWLWAMEYALNGDLTKYDALDLAEAAEWEGDADKLVDALLGCGVAGGSGFLDRTPTGKLLIHDWHKYGGKLLVVRFTDNFRKKHKGAMPTPEQIAAAGLFPLEMLVKSPVETPFQEVPVESNGIQKNPADSNVEKSRVEKSRVEKSNNPRAHVHEDSGEAAVVSENESVETEPGVDALAAFGGMDDPKPRPQRPECPEPPPPLELVRDSGDPYLPDECAPLDGVTDRAAGGRAFDWPRIAIALRKRRLPGDKARAADADYVAARLAEWAKDPKRAPWVKRLEQELAHREMDEPARYARAVVDSWNVTPPVDRSKSAAGWGNATPKPAASEGSPGYHQEARDINPERVNAAFEQQERERRERDERVRKRMEADGADPNAPFTGSVNSLFGGRSNRSAGGLKPIFQTQDEASA